MLVVKIYRFKSSCLW